MWILFLPDSVYSLLLCEDLVWQQDGASSWCTWLSCWSITVSSTGAKHLAEYQKSPVKPTSYLHMCVCRGGVRTSWCLLLCPEFKQWWIPTDMCKARRLHTETNLGQLFCEENTKAPARQAPVTGKGSVWPITSLGVILSMILDFS